MAAQLCALGLPGMRWLETRDPLERNLIQELGKRVFEERKRLDHNLAVDIANCVGMLFKK
jgi:hypothetical protein